MIQQSAVVMKMQSVPPREVGASPDPPTFKRTPQLAFVPTIINQNYGIDPAKSESLENEQLSQELNTLRKTVQALRMEKVKAKAEESFYKECVQIRKKAQPSGRYHLTPEKETSETGDRVNVPEDRMNYELNKSERRSHGVKFGRIRKNRMSVGRRSMEAGTNLTHLINIDRLYINHTPLSDTNSLVPSLEMSKQYQTLQLSRNSGS